MSGRNWENPESLIEELVTEKNRTEVLDAIVEHVESTPEYTSQATQLLRNALLTIGTQQEATVPTDAVLTHVHRYPTEASVLAEPVLRLTNHTDASVRQDATQLAGYFAGTKQVDNALIRDQLFSGLDDQPQIRKTALWGLTKVGIVSPTLLSPYRSVLVDELGDFEATDRPAKRSKVFTAETLAAMGAADDSIDEYQPETPFETNRTHVEAAAWAIQRCAQRSAFDLNPMSVRSPEDAHGIIGPLTEEVQSEMLDGSRALSVAATLATGLLPTAERNPLMCLIDACEDERSAAAKWILQQQRAANGHTLDTRNSTATELTVVENNTDLTGCVASVPYSFIEKNEQGIRDTNVTLAIQGQQEAFAWVVGLHPEDGTIKLGDCVRENAGITVGETVTVSPQKTVPANSVTIEVPSAVDMSFESAKQRVMTAETEQNPTGMITSQELRTALYPQRFSTGHQLEMRVIIDSTGIWENKKFEGRYTRVGAADTAVLPVRVVSAHPAHANAVVPETNCSITETTDLDVDTRLTDTSTTKIPFVRSHFRSPGPDEEIVTVSQYDRLLS